MSREINKDTQLCMSLSGRPGNFGTRFHNYLYQALDLNFVYKAFTTKDIEAAVKGVRAYSWLCGIDAIQRSLHSVPR
jgi:shikimate dehydrogenase